MRGCKKSCLHRALVEEYRIARHNEEMQMENVCMGYATEEEIYRSENPLITFKDWLKGHRQDRPDE